VHVHVYHLTRVQHIESALTVFIIQCYKTCLSKQVLKNPSYSSQTRLTPGEHA